MGTTNSSPSGLQSMVLLKSQIFESTGGAIIFESGVMAHYLGKNLIEETHIQQWTQFVDATETDATVQVKDKLKIFEQHFAKNTILLVNLSLLPISRPSSFCTTASDSPLIPLSARSTSPRSLVHHNC
ncbi:MAG: hypothetical protein BYD32DRAFT_486231 [Podila humilis]|nr:MAG: hypothetical protein BYD32DRAFT_486231 [Podila humilis]